MSNLLKSIESKALALPLEEQKRLVLHLLESIELRPLSDPKKVEAAWVAESKRRYEAYLRGEEQVISAEEVFAEFKEDDRCCVSSFCHQTFLVIKLIRQRFRNYYMICMA